MSNTTANESRPSFLKRMLSSGVWASALKDDDLGAIVDWFSFWFFGIGFVGLTFAGFAAAFSGGPDGLGPITAAMHPELKVPPQLAMAAWNTGLRVFALGLLLAGACACTGWLFGLLFGVPRAVVQTTDANVAAALAAAKTPATTTGRKTSTKVNTNLEDISDWLTKTLVGVGLVTLSSVPRMLGDLAFAANAYGFGWGDHGQLLALAIMLYFVPGGFWLGYVGTRTFVTGLFALFDNGWSDTVAQASQSGNLLIDGENTIRPATGPLLIADSAILGKPLQALETSDELTAWAAAQARAGNLNAASTVLENVLATDAGNQNAMRQLVKVYVAQHRGSEAAKLGRKLPDDSVPKMLAALYDLPPYSFQEAERIGAGLVKDADNNASASIHVWFACAYAQEYGYARDVDGKGAADLAPIKAKMLDEIRSALRLDPTTRQWLRNLWRPAPNDPENDLSVFAPDDPQLATVLDDAPVAGPTPADQPPPPTPPSDQRGNG